jgi:hypothetical protein
MAARPEDGGTPNYYPWATDTTQQAVTINGVTYILNNKEAPLPEFTNFGLRFKQPPLFQEINYQFNGYSLWFEHLDQRYSVGSLHHTTSAEDATAISTRLGGTWTLLGTTTIGGDSVNIFEKQS